MSLEREVEQMIDEMMKKEGWTRSRALSILRSKFESEERHQEVVYVNNLLKREETEEHTNDKDKNNSNTDFQKDY
ncbi:MAG: hypothetical protein ACJ708_02980 [Nitrososphaeraceae archaeon]|jgi:uncharacterized protein YdaT